MDNKNCIVILVRNKERKIVMHADLGMADRQNCGVARIERFFRLWPSLPPTANIRSQTKYG